MLSRLWWFVRAHVETFRQYRVGGRDRRGADLASWLQGARCGAEGRRSADGRSSGGRAGRAGGKARGRSIPLLQARRPCSAGRDARALEPAPGPDDPGDEPAPSVAPRPPETGPACRLTQRRRSARPRPPDHGFGPNHRSFIAMPVSSAISTPVVMTCTAVCTAVRRTNWMHSRASACRGSSARRPCRRARRRRAPVARLPRRRAPASPRGRRPTGGRRCRRGAKGSWDRPPGSGEATSGACRVAGWPPAGRGQKSVSR